MSSAMYSVLPVKYSPIFRVNAQLTPSELKYLSALKMEAALSSEARLEGSVQSACCVLCPASHVAGIRQFTVCCAPLI
jgi:hypothetical protein